MGDYPKTLPEFEEWFATEQACREYFRKLRWPNGFSCPRCGAEEAWFSDRDLYVCKHCRHQTSVLAGTIFQDTKKPLRLWFRAIWHITNQKYGANALGLQRVLGLGSYHTAWRWLHKLRRAMVRPGQDKLSGTIEVDESYVGGKESGNPGRGSENKELVFIAAQEDGEGIGRIRLRRIEDATAESLEQAVKQTIEPDSVVRTDGWPSYNGLTEIGYRHMAVRSGGEVGEAALPRPSQIASLLKRWLLGTYQGAVRASHLEYYLDEYTFRFNRRASRFRGKLFYRLLQQAASVNPVIGKNL